MRLGFLIGCLLSVYLGAAETALPSLEIEGSSFSKSGESMVLAAGAKDGLLKTEASVPKGQYVVLGSYRTVDFTREGRFASDAMALDWKTPCSSYQWNPAAATWVPFRLLVWCDADMPLRIRFGNRQGGGDGARIELRDVALRPYEMTGNSNWLDNGDWAAGDLGAVPPGWMLGGDGVTAAQVSLVANTSFKQGQHLLRFSASAVAKPMLTSHALFLPENGDLEFVVWARSDQPAPLTMHVVCDGWAQRSEVTHQITEAWQELHVRFSIKPGIEKRTFFVRLVPGASSTMDIADARLLWLPPGMAEAGSVVEWDGWQGVPGRNLIYNPDFELGGTGYFYDFSWPKKMADFITTRESKPTTFPVGLGVDGGTCAQVQGTMLRAWCFPVRVGKTYTYSVDLRAPPGVASADAMVLAFDTDWQAALWKGVGGISGDGWKRYTWTATWDKHNTQKRGWLGISSKSGVMIDRLQVVEGDLADYEAPPVMLALVPKKRSYVVRGRDEAEFTIRVVPGRLGEGPADITAIAHDAWGNEVWRESFSISGDERVERVKLLPTDRLGTFHVDLTARRGETVVGIGLSRYAIIDPPVNEQTRPGHPGLFGICQESFNFPAWLCIEHARIHQDLGIRLNRFFASLPPDMSLPLADDFIADLRARLQPFKDAGIDVMPCISLMPQTAMDAARSLAKPTEQDLADFATYLRAVVEPLKDSATYWEIFNEPNLWRLGEGADKGKPFLFPAKYAAYQQVAYRTIKSIDPSLQVAANALNNLPADWIRDWLAAGGGKAMDLFTFHPYGWTNAFSAIADARSLLEAGGFHGPLVNSEKYYGANLFQDRAGYEETRRGYYLPYDGELRTAGRSLQHTISHVAQGVPFCAFNPGGTLFGNVPGGELFLYDYFPALNAATRFLVQAGRGIPLDLGLPVDVFLFPQAQGGPLATICGTLGGIEGAMTGFLPTVQVFDCMGNLTLADTVAKQGIRIADDPTYLRFPLGTDEAAMRSAFANVDVRGLGDPVAIDVVASGIDTITVVLTSLSNKPIDGTLRLQNLPENIQVAQTSWPIVGLPPGETSRIDIPLVGARLDGLNPLSISCVVDIGDHFVRRDVRLRPLIVHRSDAIVADGLLGDWAKATWFELNEKHLSKAFSATLSHTGPDDCSAKIAFAWCETGIAVAVVVQDDHHHPSLSERMGWEGDSLQLYLDPRNDDGPGGLHSDDDVAYTFADIGGRANAWVDKGAEGNFKGAANKAEGFHDPDVALSIHREGSACIYEMVLPRERCLPAADLGPQRSIGASVLINDNDGKGRKAGVTLALPGTEPYGNAEGYVDLILVP